MSGRSIIRWLFVVRNRIRRANDSIDRPLADESDDAETHDQHSQADEECYQPLVINEGADVLSPGNADWESWSPVCRSRWASTMISMHAEEIGTGAASELERLRKIADADGKGEPQS